MCISNRNYYVIHGLIESACFNYNLTEIHTCRVPDIIKFTYYHCTSQCTL